MPERQAGFLDNPLIRLNGRQGGLNMGFMETMQAKMDATLVPVASKLNGQRHVAAVRDAFTLAFPLTLAGSIITLVNFAVLSPDGFIAKLLHLGALIPNLADYQKIFKYFLSPGSLSAFLSECGKTRRAFFRRLQGAGSGGVSESGGPAVQKYRKEPGCRLWCCQGWRGERESCRAGG